MPAACPPPPCLRGRARLGRSGARGSGGRCAASPPRPPPPRRAGYVDAHVKMDVAIGLLGLLTVLLEGSSGQGVYGESGARRDLVATVAGAGGGGVPPARSRGRRARAARRGSRRSQSGGSAVAMRR